MSIHLPGKKKYGIDFADPERFGGIHFTDAMVELYMMSNKIGEADGGLGEHKHLRNAMELLWPTVYAGEMEPGVLKWRDAIHDLTWAWCNYKITSVIGHASAGKTHTFGHVAAAYYIADSVDTIITLTSTHLPGLRKRLWSDAVAAIRSADLGDGMIGKDFFSVRGHDMTIRPQSDHIEDKYVIEGIATDRGQEAVEKIQGNHSRKKRFVIIDEAQGTPSAIFEAAANLMTDQDFRMAQLANPTKRFSEFGTWCEPSAGWHNIDPETDTHWETERGGVCLRLDGLKSPNIVHNKTIFPFLIRPDYLEEVEKAFGEGSPRWWTFVRGWFAPEGLAGVVCPSSVVGKAEAQHEYSFAPTKIASLDPAFEGGDQCVLMIAEYGSAKGSQYAMNLLDSIPLKLAMTENSDPLDFLIAAETERICRREGVKPEHLIVDVTGAGRGVAAILAKDWGSVVRCSFGAACSDRPVRAGEPETAAELFDRFVSELWWSARVWMEEGLVGNVGINFKKLREQLVARQYETVRDKKISVEKKKDMKNRLGYSPDEADAFCLLIELLRRQGGVAGSASAKPRGRISSHSQLARKLSRNLSPNSEYAHG